MADVELNTELDRYERLIFVQKETLQLARQGKDAWNTWAAGQDNLDVTINFSGYDFKEELIKFTGFNFPMDVNFSGSTFLNADFSGAEFKSGGADFSKVIFNGKHTNFSLIKFSGGSTKFIGAKFLCDYVNFAKSEFSRGNVDFTETEFSCGDVNFENVEFGDGKTIFQNAKFSCEVVNFTGTKFNGRETNFSQTEFTCIYTDFSWAKFSGDNTIFQETKFNGGNALFLETEFRSSNTLFQKAEFSGGNANFIGAIFHGTSTIFDNAKFSGGNANFTKARFECKYANFVGTDYNKVMNFTGASFECSSNFSYARNAAAVVFKDSEFKYVPDLRFTDFKVHFSLHGMKVGLEDGLEAKLYGGFRWRKVSVRDIADKLRRLKDLASAAKDHEREQEFFALELRAKRFHETTRFSGLMLSILYEKCSDFGRSFLRPSLIFLGVWAVFASGYWAVSSAATATIWDGMRLSGSVMMPFSASAKAAFEVSQVALFCDLGGFSVLFDAVVIFQGLLSLACVFLIGLALRNRFKI